MWPPADIYALPTRRELIDAKSAIQTVKARLAQAQLRVDEINKELFEREAWIAPVRYLSFDVLSLIFEFCGEDNWRTTLRISEVSRDWRKIVLATPRAWAFFSLGAVRKGDQIIHRFFSRSGHCPLHVRLSILIADPARILSSVGKRLKCLSTHVINTYLEGRVFPILDRLTLRRADDNSPIEISYFNEIQFPSLRHLLCAISLTNSSGVTQWTFPPLQSLSLEMTSDLAWLDLLVGVKDTLISLRFSPIRQCTGQNYQITLPALKCLDIAHLDEAASWFLDLKTPVLETYLEHSHRALDESLWHRDTRNVRNMSLSCMPMLSSFPLLEILQFREESFARGVLSEFASSGSLCPNLREIEVGNNASYTHGRFNKDLLRVNHHRPSPLQVVFTGYPGRKLPYAIKDRPCGDKMPCI